MYLRGSARWRPSRWASPKGFVGPIATRGPSPGKCASSYHTFSDVPDPRRNLSLSVVYADKGGGMSASWFTLDKRSDNPR